jgi:hypothetical protein
MYVKNEYGYKKRVKKKTKRPAYITYLCLAVVAYGFWNIISSYIGVYSGFGTLYPAINALMVVFSFVAISGVWSMEKWGPISFPIVITLKLLVDLMWGHFNPWILLAFIPAAVFLSLFPKMKRGE